MMSNVVPPRTPAIPPKGKPQRPPEEAPYFGPYPPPKDAQDLRQQYPDPQRYTEEDCWRLMAEHGLKAQCYCVSSGGWAVYHVLRADEVVPADGDPCVYALTCFFTDYPWDAVHARILDATGPQPWD
jgi:hypothetical protein